MLWKLILRCSGWKVTGYEKLHQLPKYVIAIAPHTSNWDFIVGIIVKFSLGLRKVKYLGKESLFKFPHGFLFYILGGFPVPQSTSQNQVQSYIQFFNRHKEFAIVLSPEGSRKKVDRLKTGYYYIAKGAGVPVIPSIMNYKTRTVSFLEPFYPGQDIPGDLQHLNNLFHSDVGKYPEDSYSVNPD
jgi:1-acyl-sn-glycerol-3-phosphate acyltransferase